MKNTKKTLINIVLIIFLLLSIPIVYTNPRVTENENFDLNTAITHIQNISKESHSIGMDNHNVVRDYLMDVLKEYNVKAEIQEDIGFNSAFNSIGSVKNIAARIDCGSTDDAILVMAHYDSVPTTYGANDNGAGVACVLQSAKLAASVKGAQNDVIILLSDGEEEGMLGAQAFIANHRWAEDIKFCINADARGTTGPVMMYESTPYDYNTMVQMNKAGVNVISNSLMAGLYNMMPNFSDFTITKQENIQGLNFAYIGGFHNYHSYYDNLNNMNTQSLQSLGNKTVKSLEHFLYVSLDDLQSESNAVYFNVLPNRIMILPSIVLKILAATTVILLIAAFIVCIKEKRITIKGILLSIALFIINITVSIGAVIIVQQVVKLLSAELYTKLAADSYSSMPMFLMIAILVLFVNYLLTKLFSKWIKINDYLLLNALLFTVFAAASGLLFVQSSFMFVFPTLALLIVLHISELKDNENLGKYKQYLFYIPFIIAAIIFMPLLSTVTDAFGLKQAILIIPFLVMVFAIVLPSIVYSDIKIRFSLALFIVLIAGLFVVELLFFSVQTDEGRNKFYNYDKPAIIISRTEDGAYESYSEHINMDVSKTDFTNLIESYKPNIKYNKKEADGLIYNNINVFPKYNSSQIYVMIYFKSGNIKNILINGFEASVEETTQVIAVCMKQGLDMNIVSKGECTFDYSVKEICFLQSNSQINDFSKKADILEAEDLSYVEIGYSSAYSVK